MAELTIHRLNSYKIHHEMPDNSMFVGLLSPDKSMELSFFFDNKAQWLAFRKAFGRSKDYSMSTEEGTIKSLEDAEAYAESLNVD